MHPVDEVDRQELANSVNAVPYADVDTAWAEPAPLERGGGFGVEEVERLPPSICAEGLGTDSSPHQPFQSSFSTAPAAGRTSRGP